jgi:O-glycosyl hydrolase
MGFTAYLFGSYLSMFVQNARRPRDAVIKLWAWNKTLLRLDQRKMVKVDDLQEMKNLPGIGIHCKNGNVVQSCYQHGAGQVSVKM